MVEQASLGSFTQFPSLVARYSIIFLLSMGCAILFLHHADSPPFFFLNIPFSLPKSGIRIYRNFDTKSAKAWCARSRILRIRLFSLAILLSSLQRAGDYSATSWRVRWYWDAMATAARFLRLLLFRITRHTRFLCRISRSFGDHATGITMALYTRWFQDGQFYAIHRAFQAPNIRQCWA